MSSVIIPLVATQEESVEMKQMIDVLTSNVLSVGEECISESELRSLIKRKVVIDNGKFNLYDGFEPSGRMHIAQGVFKAFNVNKVIISTFYMHHLPFRRHEQ